MYETPISFQHSDIGKYKVDFQKTGIGSKYGQNKISFQMQLEITNPVAAISHGFEMIFKTNGTEEIGRIFNLVGFDFSSKYTYNFNPTFILSNSALEHIEATRKNDIQINLDIVLHVRKKIKIKNDHGSELEASDSTHHLAFGYLNFTIPKSFWIENIINNSTLQKIALVEIPIGSIPDIDFFIETIGELKEAQSYYLQGDYDKSVAHCRSLLESLLKEKNQLLSFSESDSNKKAFIDANKLTFEWLDNTRKAIKAITNKPHHSPSMGHFGREESYSIMLICSAILKFWSSQIKAVKDI